MLKQTVTNYSLADSKDVLVNRINHLRRELNISKPAGEAALPTIQKRNLLAIINELDMVAYARATNDPRAEEMAAFAELTDEQQHASHFATVAPVKADPIGDPPVTQAELDRVDDKVAEIERLLAQLKVAVLPASKKALRTKLRRLGYRLSDHTR